MKILFLIPKFSGGGAEFVARQWMEYLTSVGDEVMAAATNLGGDEEPPPGINVVGIPSRALRSIVAVRRLIREEQPDVVVALMPFWNLLAVTSTRGLRSRPIVVISGRNMSVHLRSSFGVAYRVKQAMAKRVYRWADEFVAISHPVAGEAIALYGLRPERVSVVFNPSIKCEVTSSVRATDAGRPIAVVSPARLVHQKRPQLVIDTVAFIRRMYGVDAEAHFFGTGPMESEVKNRAVQIGVVAHFHGWVSDWSVQVPSNAVVLLPSLSEGFGNVLVEAAQVGVPSVATSRASGVADAIVPGVTGVLCPGDSAVDFAEGVMQASNMFPAENDAWLANFTKQASGEALRRRLISLVQPT